MNRHNSPAIVAIIPAYNPGAVVSSVIEKTASQVTAVVVVNDGCDNENTRILNAACLLDNVHQITFCANKGKGFALFAGFEKALALGADYILTIDSDGQHDPEEIPAFIAHAAHSFNSDGLVIGGRDETKMPLRSKFGNVFTAKLFSALFFHENMDTQSGFRLLSRGFTASFIAHTNPGRYETEMKMLIFAKNASYYIGTVKIKTRYIDGNSNSKFQPVKDSLRVLKSFHKYTFIAIASFLVDYGLFLLLNLFLVKHYLISHVAARVLSGLFNYAINKKFVFKSKGAHATESIRYLLASLMSLVGAGLMLALMVDVINFQAVMAKPAADILMFVVNFFVLKNFVFKFKEIK